MLIVDAHLDLSYNALVGRNVLLPAVEQTADEGGVPTVGLPDLRAGGVAFVCATIFCQPALGDKPGYRTADEAHAMAWEHLAWYRRARDAGELRFLTTAADVAEVRARRAGAADGTAEIAPARGAPAARAGALGADDSAAGSLAAAAGRGSSAATLLAAPARPLSAILLMEGADPFRTPDDVVPWFDAGLRCVGLAWKRTRMAGGTGAPGSLTSEGVALVRALDRAGIIHDASHLAEESFWHLLEISPGPVMASHSNCREIVPTDRQLSDPMIRALVKRGGVIGINFFDRFLLPSDEYGRRRATLRDVVRHAQHVCDLAGDARHVGLGTDMDGGLGRNEIPVEIGTSADLPEVEDALAEAGFTDQDVAGIMGGNWGRFFEANLPGGVGAGALKTEQPPCDAEHPTAT